MWSVLSTAWHVVVRRAMADRMILLAAALTILLATMLVASGPIYANAVTLSSVQRTLSDAEVAAANVAISTRVTAATFAATDELVSDQLDRSFALPGYTEWRRITSDSYSLPVGPDEAVTDLAVFRYFEDIEKHASILEGSWPSATGVPYESSIPDAAAAALSLKVGDELELTSRRDSTSRVRTRIAGIYRVDDPQDPFWYSDELDVAAISEGPSFTTFGPFVVPLETFFTAATPTGAKADWR
ncbi:MAG: hypothetical protein HKN80_02465, partial [Acidimicrobiia bacterium]|nr:hypothetical protein [Acidimicrobiia bacterium]